ncbi:hypothetical protein [Moraxella nonliquefaciens]|nr:hypothetical protein [Moraxella nonliquefaciens]
MSNGVNYTVFIYEAVFDFFWGGFMDGFSVSDMILPTDGFYHAHHSLT